MLKSKFWLGKNFLVIRNFKFQNDKPPFILNNKYLIEFDGRQHFQ